MDEGVLDQPINKQALNEALAEFPSSICWMLRRSVTAFA